jgi:hypothetical protein
VSWVGVSKLLTTPAINLVFQAYCLPAVRTITSSWLRYILSLPLPSERPPKEFLSPRSISSLESAAISTLAPPAQNLEV